MIYELCILDAATCVCNTERRSRWPPPLNRPIRWEILSCEDEKKISVKFQGTKIETRNIGPLPLLFANKQIHDELSRMVYSRFAYVDCVSDAFSSREIFEKCREWDDWVPMRRWPNLRYVPSLRLRFSEEAQACMKGWMLDSKLSTRKMSSQWPSVIDLVEYAQEVQADLTVDIGRTAEWPHYFPRSLNTFLHDLKLEERLSWLTPLAGLSEKCRFRLWGFLGYVHISSDFSDFLAEALLVGTKTTKRAYSIDDPQRISYVELQVVNADMEIWKQMVLNRRLGLRERFTRRLSRVLASVY